MATLTQISTEKDVYEFALSDDEAAELNGEGHYEVVFQNEDDVSARGMFAKQASCTVTVAKGSAFTDAYTVTDSDGASVSGEVTFG